MPVGITIAEMDIENFRGIEQLQLQFAPGRVSYLIGSNNSGKSTVLNAMALALKGGGFHRYTPDAYDFRKNVEGEHVDRFRIELLFDSVEGFSLPAVQGVGNPVEVHGIRCFGERRSEDTLTLRHVLIDTDGKAVTLSDRTPLKGKAKEQYGPQGPGYRKHYADLNEIAKHLPEIWLLSPGNLERSLFEWKTGPMRRLVSLLSRQFLEDEWTIEYGDRSLPMPDYVHKTYDFLRQSVAEFLFWKHELKPRLQDRLAQYVGRNASVELSPMLSSVEDWLVQQLSASLAVSDSTPLTPLHRMGSGWQSLVRLAALEVLSDFSDTSLGQVALLFEEPDTYLHPHLRRRLRHLLGDLAERQGFYVVVATHAAEFIDFTSSQRIVRLWRDGHRTVTGSFDSSELDSRLQLQQKLEQHHTHEFLFGNAVVVCEGKDDRYAITLYLAKLGVDIDALSVTVLAAESRDNIPAYAKAASALRIPWLAVTDEDVASDGKPHPKSQKVRDSLDRFAGSRDRSLYWHGKLENVLKVPQHVPKARPEWQANELEPLSIGQIRYQYPDYAVIVEQIREWIENPQSTQGSETQ